MTTLCSEKRTSTQPTLVIFISLFQNANRFFTEEEEIQLIIGHWVRTLNIKLGWIQDFDTLVVNYASTIFMLDTFRSSSKLLKTFFGHTKQVWSIDYSTFNDSKFICSGSGDKTVRVWDLETNKQIQSFHEYVNDVYCVKFSPYHIHNHRRNVICSSSNNNTVRFLDVKDSQQLQVFNGHTAWVCGIEFSPFNGNRYVCSGSGDKTIRLWDIETSKSLHIFNRHTNVVWCVDFSPLQSNNSDNNKNNSIGVVGGNGYTICSGSNDKTIRIWDIETTKQLITFIGHELLVMSIKYGSNELLNTILSGSSDKSVRLWDIRSGKQIQVFNGHTNWVNAVEFSPFLVNNDNEVGGSSNVICSGSKDNTIRFWDIRSNNKELHLIKEDDKEDNGIFCLKFLQLKNNSRSCYINLCYGSKKGPIRIWG
ncbi:WD-40 repeat protein [Reticulomyxa filosa]|uniref:WD-40 repeat protein n=1 Tax=Reticulomyxa filosa TaxID=46433 RepID=X6MBH6_RETFI|nr:WD-40 repeat protein [Reticulomyxa filosa]|eukprot:ETO11021.1 WD-40 repeat protein [Reticulomyxa filosa]